MTGVDELAAAVAERTNPTSLPAMIDARITACGVGYLDGVWTVESVTVRPLSSRDELPASWSTAFELEVTAAQGKDMVGKVVEVHIIGGRPRIAYTVRG